MHTRKDSDVYQAEDVTFLTLVITSGALCTSLPAQGIIQIVWDTKYNLMLKLYRWLHIKVPVYISWV